ncbi:VRR-NUC domain-containing protein [Bradyrhizobium sp.]|uniref:VRR-NUC domain-containing protein n=1 Tax=Bradyrhizobium sp. TaxID=376 RepID=UPI003C73A6CF
MEVKRPGGRLSPDQQRIADHMKRAGHRFEVVDSVEAAISVLVVWGVARGMAVQ